MVIILVAALMGACGWFAHAGLAALAASRTTSAVDSRD